MAKVVELTIEGMSCEHCVNAVTKALRSAPGVREASVSLEAKAARVEGEDFDPQALVSAVREEGYEATLKA